MARKLEGRTALITGGSRGIGAAIAKAFAREGARVAFTYRARSASAREVVAEIQAAGGEAFAIQADAADVADAKRAVDETVGRYQHINILVNNAGAIGREFTVRDMPVEEWDRLIGTDLRGVFLATKFALPYIPTDPVGKIINISSELARKGRPTQAHYCAAKAGIEGFTRALQLEVGPGICVNSLAPGPIATDLILADMSPEWIKKETEILAERLGTVDEIAAPAVLLASDDGNFFLGQFISPNGGAVFT
ncbi:MAG TPA: SDR family NAD(P)-dependent oxidoreductase [Candidatus Dormibacteraeota bacterium]